MALRSKLPDVVNQEPFDPGISVGERLLYLLISLSKLDSDKLALVLPYLEIGYNESWTDVRLPGDPWDIIRTMQSDPNAVKPAMPHPLQRRIVLPDAMVTLPTERLGSVRIWTRVLFWALSFVNFRNKYIYPAMGKAQINPGRFSRSDVDKALDELGSAWIPLLGRALEYMDRSVDGRVTYDYSDQVIVDRYATVGPHRRRVRLYKVVNVRPVEAAVVREDLIRQLYCSLLALKIAMPIPLGGDLGASMLEGNPFSSEERIEYARRLREQAFGSFLEALYNWVEHLKEGNWWSDAQGLLWKGVEAGLSLGDFDPVKTALRDALYEVERYFVETIDVPLEEGLTGFGRNTAAKWIRDGLYGNLPVRREFVVPDYRLPGGNPDLEAIRVFLETYQDREGAMGRLLFRADLFEGKRAWTAAENGTLEIGDVQKLIDNGAGMMWAVSRRGEVDWSVWAGVLYAMARVSQDFFARLKEVRRGVSGAEHKNDPRADDFVNFKTTEGTYDSSIDPMMLARRNQYEVEEFLIPALHERVTEALREFRTDQAVQIAQDLDLLPEHVRRLQRGAA